MLSINQRHQAIAMLNTGQTYERVANHFRVAISTLVRLRRKYRQTGSVVDLPRSGRPRETTLRQDRALRLSHLRNRFKTATESARNTPGRTRRHISAQTVRRRLRVAGIRCRRPYVGARLTNVHRQNRMNWAQIHRRWIARQWRDTLFTDESKFQIDFCDRRQNVYRRRGERFSDACVKELDRFGKASCMVWGGISYYGKTDLIFIDRPPVRRGRNLRNPGLTAQRYIDEILRPVVLPYIAAHPGMRFQQDNARAHSARITTAFLAQNAVQTLPWPAYSPDMNPIEHLWDVLGKKIRENQVNNQNQLRNALRAEWANIDMRTIRNLIGSMRRRCTAVVAARGGHTKY